ncbi:sialidase-1-like isoform X2 [Oscarella lobularis]|uniref:sialidase-1-like isoform X2 n=1 Tax=Oscarella lobularis TaxID=121494 RepID=UPI00331397E2
MMANGSLVLYFSIIFSSSAGLFLNPFVEEEFILWSKQGDGDVDRFRIPIATWNERGAIVAVSEARKSTSADGSAKFLAVRRMAHSQWSKDAWSPTMFVENDGFASDGVNLGAVLSTTNGTTIVVYGRCMHACPKTQTFTMTSHDDGLTWEEPVDITEQIGGVYEIFAGGPGYGIQKRHDPHQGRLIFCGWNGTAPASDDPLKTMGVKCIYSDDEGMRWKSGAWIPGIPHGEDKAAHDFIPSENQFVELSDGSILITTRNTAGYHGPYRVLARSFDAIETIPSNTITIATDLVTPGCAGSLLYVDERDLLLHSNPFHSTQRINMSLSWSTDGGRTWPGHMQVYPGPSGYSTLVRIPGEGNRNRVGLLYETGENGGAYNEMIAMAVINLNVTG